MLRSILPLFLFACAAPPPPVIEAHRGADGYYPQNSRTAMLASMNDGYAGLHLDIALTADEVPVLAADPWVQPALCERVDGEPIAERVRIDGLSLEQLQQSFLCGGLPDPRFPNAAVHADTIMTLDEVIEALRFNEASMEVHIEAQFEPGWTASADAFADAVLSRWFAADPPQRFYIGANTAEAVEAFEAWGNAHAKDVPTRLTWPRTEPGIDRPDAESLRDLRASVGLESPVRLAEEAGADGLNLYWEFTERATAQAAADRGLQVGLWTLDEPVELAVHARWPVHTLVASYPGDLP